MALQGEYEPSPWEPIAEQVTRHERTDGYQAKTDHVILALAQEPT